MTAKTVFRLALLAAALLIVVLVELVKSIDVDHYRALVSRQVLLQTGRTLTFAGPLSLRLSLRPAVVTDGITLSAGPGAAPDDVARLDHVEAEISLLPLLSGEVRIGRLWIDGADLTLTPEDGAAAAAVSAPVAADIAGAAPATALRLTQIRLEHVTLRWAGGLAPHQLTIERATLDSDGVTAPTALTLEWDGRRLAVSGLLSSLRDLVSRDKPLTLQLKVLRPGLIVSLEGWLHQPQGQEPSLQLAVALELADSADLDSWIGLPLPSLGAARAALSLEGPLERPRLSQVEATLGRHDAVAISVKGSVADPVGGSGIDLALQIDGDATAMLAPNAVANGLPRGTSAAIPAATTASAAAALGGPPGGWPLALAGHISSNGSGSERGWRIADLKGSLGRSDLTGQMTVQRHGGHPRIDGHFQSQWVDLTRPDAASVESAPSASDARVFSDAPLPLGWLAESDGHVSWQVQRLTDRRLDSANHRFELDWQDARLVLTAGIGSIAGGSISGRLSLDAAARPPLVTTDAAVTHVMVGDLLTALGQSGGIQGGRLDLHFHATGSGLSPRAIFASQQGKSALALGPSGIDRSLTGGGLGAVPGPGQRRSALPDQLLHLQRRSGPLRGAAVQSWRHDGDRAGQHQSAERKSRFHSDAATGRAGRRQSDRCQRQPAASAGQSRQGCHCQKPAGGDRRS
jgi:hypothetical protein